MALLFYSDASMTTELTTVTTQHDSAGESKDVEIFIGNKDAGFRYEEIVITPEDTATPPDEKNWIQVGLTQGNYEAPGASLTFPDISDNASHSLWIRITTANVGTAQNKTDLRLNATFKEFAS